VEQIVDTAHRVEDLGVSEIDSEVVGLDQKHFLEAVLRF